MAPPNYESGFGAEAPPGNGFGSPSPSDGPWDTGYGAPITLDEEVDVAVLGSAVDYLTTEMGYRPKVLKSSAPDVTTVGTTEELLASYAIAAGVFATQGARLELKTIWASQDNTNSQTYTVKLGGTTIATSTFSHSATGTPLTVVSDIICNGSSDQYTRNLHVLGDTAPVQTSAFSMANMGVGATLGIYATTPSAAGDLILLYWSLTLYPAVA